MLFSLFGENYYIDLDKVEKEVEMTNSSGESQIHLVKYEMVKMMVDNDLNKVKKECLKNP
jgi:ferredoxin-fold anticodon binding domain-containing protein